MKVTRSLLALVSAAMFAAAMPAPASAQIEATTICRGPGYWQNHAGSEKDGDNVTQEVITDLNDGDPLVVCGSVIWNTDYIGGLDSALEGLCVRTRGVQQRQLYRQLITARLNCSVSEGANCDEIVDRTVDVKYSDCDALCTGDPVVDGPTEEACIEELSCFNGGGRMVEGECVKGTCNDDGVTLCGNDEDCGDEGDCVRFADSCANTQLCTDELLTEASVCPKGGRASSPRVCQAARRNGCTIDDYSCYGSCEFEDDCLAACEATEGCDPSFACASQENCFDYCLLYTNGFGDGTPCGCEYEWAVYCGYNAENPAEYYNCLSFYQEAEYFGFCPACSDDPANCLWL